MIQSISITPVYNNGENLEVKKVTGFGIFIDCDVQDAEGIFNLLKEMIGRQDSIESEDEVHPSCKLYGIDIIKDKGR